MHHPDKRENGFYWISINDEAIEIAQWRNESHDWLIFESELPLRTDETVTVFGKVLNLSGKNTKASTHPFLSHSSVFTHAPCAPTPAIAGERGLVDDVGAGAHGGLGLGVGLREVAVVEGDLDDLATFASEVREERRLVLIALLGDEVGELVAAVRAASLLPGRLELQPSQVRAGKVRREVGGREPEVAVAELHSRSIARSGPIAHGQAHGTPNVSSAGERGCHYHETLTGAGIEPTNRWAISACRFLKTGRLSDYPRGRSLPVS